jgi:DNA-binding transcriptional MerR regulator
VLFFRELGFALDEIRLILEDPSYARSEALARQKSLLEEKTERLLAMINAIDRSLVAKEQGVNMTDEEKLKVFGDFDPDEHEAEVQERWGGTDEYAESRTRTKDYTKGEWEKINAEAAEIYAEFVALMPDGADTLAARDAVARHRQHISRWYYPCKPEIHAGLGQMYMADDRFRQNIDKTAEGLAAFMADSFEALYS